MRQSAAGAALQKRSSFLSQMWYADQTAAAAAAIVASRV